nr:Uncharacterised protein [Ipomoea batatas]
MMKSIVLSCIYKHLLPFSHIDIVIHHHLHQLLKSHFRFPPQHLLRLAGIAFQIIHLRRPEVALVNHDVIFPVQPNIPKRHLQELLHGVRLLRGHHEELALEPDFDPPYRPGYLPGHEILPASRGFVVEEDSVAGEDPVGFSVIHGVPMRRAFGHRVGRSRMERSRLRLRRRSGSEHLRRSGLVVPDMNPTGRRDVRPHRLQEAERAGGDHVGGVIRNFKRHRDVRLRGEVVDLVGKDYVIDPLRIEIRRSTNEAVNFIAFVEEKFSECDFPGSLKRRRWHFGAVGVGGFGSVTAGSHLGKMGQNGNEDLTVSN